MNIFMRVKPYATITTIAFTCVVFAMQLTQMGDYIVGYGGLNRFFEQGAFWQPLTTLFVHGGLMHLAMNMVVLFQFGTLLEAARGRAFFVFVYYGGGVATSLLTYLFIKTFDMGNINVIGASGAICVIIGWIAQKDSFNRQGLIIAILAISFLPLLVGMNVAWYGHLIGFAVGWIIGKMRR